MKPSTAPGECSSLADLTRASDYGARILEFLPSISEAPDAEAAVCLFKRALQLIGADAGVFQSVIRDDAMRTTYRSVLACDPLWAVEYAKHGWHDCDPWLRHALRSEEPTLGTALDVRPDEEAFVTTSASLGFASAVVAPAPSCAGTSRVGVLTLGSHNVGFFEDEGYRLVRVIAKALAMELHRWLLQAIRKELLTLSRITAAELDLLRHEEAGHTSKMIGAALHIEPKTVDCRFQRLSAKLEAPDRRTAARIARLYGLI